MADHQAIDQAIAEHELRDYAEQLGYTVGILTDGTIVCEPRPDPKHCGICHTAAEVRDAVSAGGDQCADCGVELTVLTRCQRVIQGDGLKFSLRFVCPEHYANPCDI